MRGIGVARVEGERPLDLGDALGDVAQLDARPAEIGEEPPILVPARCQGFEERQLRLVEIGPPAKAEEAKNAERQGQHQRVPGKFGDVLQEHRHRLWSPAVDGQRHRLDVPGLARADPATEGARRRRRVPGLGDPRLDRQEPRPGDVRQREFGVGRERGVEQRLGADIGRQHQVDRCDVVLRRPGR
jgi:hypothetical protein